jgi:DNA-binding MarR family transcriptional regulator
MDVDMSTSISYIEVMSGLLTRNQFDAWRGFRFMVEETSLCVSRELFSSTGMSGGQFGILTILVETPLHVMRQQELADAMRWDRTRLSHQLTRMETRGWINREKGDKGATLVWLAEAGRQEQHRAAPVLSQIVKERFFSRLTQAQLTTLEEIRAALTIE